VRRLGILLVVGSLILMGACGSSSGGGNTTSTITSVTVTCSPSTLQSDQTSQCTATVTGTGNFNSGVSWAASAGTITTAGLFTAPVVPTTTSVTITAVSTQNTAVSGAFTVTVTPTGTITSVTVTCSPSTIQSSQTSQCSATVAGTGNYSSAVTWTASAGTISSMGLFTAPVVSSMTSVTITATSVQDSTKSGTATVTVNPVQTANNVAPIMVDSGPKGLTPPSVNVPFVTIMICVPGSTTQCQTIDHVTVDTGSSGLRIVSSPVLTISLPPENDASGNPLDECLVFADGYVWGPVATADIYVAGEKASSVPVQITIPATSSPPVPSSCSKQNPLGGNGNEGGSVDAFGANALIGVGLFRQDCGEPCVSSSPPQYYDCPSSGCNPTNVALAQQVANPVVLFTGDNNGVLIQLPTVPDGGSQNPTGSLIFGIGTQSNNQLGSANIYPVPDTGNNKGNFITAFNGNSCPQSFIDSGSNGIFFLNTAATGIPLCANPNQSWYCPTTSPDNLSATNQGQSTSGPVGSPIPVSFSIENAATLFKNNGGSTAFSTLGGPNPGAFDWGLSFFFGRNVFTAIENLNAGGTMGPYFAY